MATVKTTDLDTHLEEFRTAINNDNFKDASKALVNYRAVWIRIGKKSARDEAGEAEYPNPKELREELNHHRDLIREEDGSSFEEGFIGRPDTTY